MCMGGRTGRAWRLVPAMREQNDTKWRQIAELATRRHGVVSHRELLAAGFSPSAVSRAVGAGGSTGSTGACTRSGTAP